MRDQRVEGSGLSTLATLLRNRYQPVPSYWPLQHPCLTEYFSRPGKWLRPLFILSAERTARAYTDHQSVSKAFCGLTSMSATVHLAICLERFHTGCLLLDDWLDHATERRGKPSLDQMLVNEGVADVPGYLLNISLLTVADLWNATLQATGMSPEDALVEQFLHPTSPTDYSSHKEEIFVRVGEAIALLEADLHHRHCHSWQQKALESCLAAFDDTLEGERIDLDWSRQKHIPSLEELFQLQMLKTTRYSVEFPLVVGFLIGQTEADPVVLAALTGYAKAFGEAFQIIDDCLVAMPESKAGKSTRSDLIQGSMTTVTVLTYQLLPGATKKGEWLRCLQCCRTSTEAQEEALRTIQESGALGSCQTMVRERVSQCHAYLSTLRKLGYDTRLLEELTDRGIGWMDDDPWGGPKGCAE